MSVTTNVTLDGVEYKARRAKCAALKTLGIATQDFRKGGDAAAAETSFLFLDIISTFVSSCLISFDPTMTPEHVMAIGEQPELLKAYMDLMTFSSLEESTEGKPLVQ